MASGSAIMGNHTSRRYAVWDNGWRPLKPETHLETDGWWYHLRQDTLHSRKITVVTQCRRRCLQRGYCKCWSGIISRLTEVQPLLYWLLYCFVFINNTTLPFFSFYILYILLYIIIYVWYASARQRCVHVCIAWHAWLHTIHPFIPLGFFLLINPVIILYCSKK